MNEERDIMRVALPFVLGVLSASLFSVSYSYTANSASLLLTVVCLMIMMNPSFPIMPPRLKLAAVLMLTFSTGFLCYRTSFLADISSLGSSGPIRNTAESFCSSLASSVDALPFRNQETSAIIKALITGDRSSLSAETTASFRTSGAAHILALSGLHLGIIYGLLKKVMYPIGNSPAALKTKSVLIMTSCGFYTLATGAGDSITRAFLFILLNETASITHRRHTLKDIFFSALIIQLILEPLSIRSAGFQLSYSAMAGITFINPLLKRLWPSDGTRPGPVEKIWDICSMSISCQITTSPLAWHLFGSIPRHFLLTNLIAMPLTGLIIPVSLATVVLSTAGICPDIIIRMNEALVQSLAGALDTIAGM